MVETVVLDDGNVLWKAFHVCLGDSQKGSNRVLKTSWSSEVGDARLLHRGARLALSLYAVTGKRGEGDDSSLLSANEKRVLIAYVALPVVLSRSVLSLSLCVCASRDETRSLSFQDATLGSFSDDTLREDESAFLQRT